jgi:DNA repair exonuclease SbcCD ATPase subunit
MTIKQYAVKEGVSPQAVYQRLKNNKIRVDSLTEKGSGDITGEGIVILDKLFNPENRQIKPAKDEKIEALEQQVSELRAKLSSKEECIKRLEEQAASLKEDKDYFKQALDKAQSNFSELKALMPGAQASPAGDRKLTWRERFSGKISSSKG